ncbi:hypothetical protein [Actinorhabdospora filicis]|nr:hypothetical protein [Actinorhabdospora filicis]
MDHADEEEAFELLWIVLAGLAENESAPEDVRERVADFARPGPIHQPGAADESAPRTEREIPEERLLELAADEDTRMDIAEREHLSPAVLDLLVTTALSRDWDAHLIAYGLAPRRELSEDTRAELLDLMDDTPGSFPTGLLRTPELEWLRLAPLGERLPYAASPAWIMRATVASSPGLPGPVAATLWEDRDLRVAAEARLHPSTPREYIADILLRYELPISAWRFARHPSFPAEILPRLAGSGPPHRRFAAGCRALDPALIIALTEDPDGEVVAAAARNPSLPVPYMYSLLTRAGR